MEKTSRSTFELNTFFLNLHLLIVIFMKENKAVVSEKPHLDNRLESFLLTTFWKLWTIKILMQGPKSKVFQTNFPLQERSF